MKIGLRQLFAIIAAKDNPPFVFSKTKPNLLRSDRAGRD